MNTLPEESIIRSLIGYLQSVCIVEWLIQYLFGLFFDSFSETNEAHRSPLKILPHKPRAIHPILECGFLWSRDLWSPSASNPLDRARSERREARSRLSAAPRAGNYADHPGLILRILKVSSPRLNYTNFYVFRKRQSLVSSNGDTKAPYGRNFDADITSPRPARNRRPSGCMRRCRISVSTRFGSYTGLCRKPVAPSRAGHGVRKARRRWRRRRGRGRR